MAWVHSSEYRIMYAQIIYDRSITVNQPQLLEDSSNCDRELLFSTAVLLVIMVGSSFVFGVSSVYAIVLGRALGGAVSVDWR